jgi:type II secretory pathway pseudopilin PulG
MNISIKSHKNPSSGFTLIELFLVILLIAVFVGLVIPRVAVLFLGYEFHTTAEKIEKMIFFAQQEAVNNSIYYRLRFDRSDKTFRLEKKDLDQDDYQMIEGPLGQLHSLPEKIELDIFRTDTIYFFPDGTTTQAEFSLQYDRKEKVIFSLSGAPFGLKIKYS